MNGFSISPTLNKNKVFLLQKSEINKRLDPFFYSPLNKLAILENTKLPKKRLSEVAELKRGKFSHRPRNDERFFGGKYPFIQTGEIVKASNSLGKIEYSQTLNELGLSVSKLFDEEVLLITIAANIGDTAILDYPACFPDSIVAISSKDKNVSLKYLNVYFKFLKKYLENLAPSAAQKNLTLEQLAPTPVVLPTLANQNKIVQIFDNYIDQKQKNEAEAEKLLASIDDYLLKELGITLPVPPENTLKNRMFISTYKQLSGNRYDPFYFKSYFVELEKSINKSKYKLIKLSSVCNLQNGYAFKSSDYTEFSETLNVRMSNIRPNNVFDPDYNPRYLPNEYAETYKEFLLNDGDVIIAMTDMAGDPKILGVPTIISNSNDRKLLLNQRVGKLFDFNTSIINVAYLKEILGARMVKEYYNKMGARGVQINISSEQILSAKIPVPPLDKQKEIAEHISAIRKQAQQLKEKTKEALKKASEEIENILIG